LTLLVDPARVNVPAYFYSLGTERSKSPARVFLLLTFFSDLEIIFDRFENTIPGSYYFAVPEECVSRLNSTASLFSYFNMQSNIASSNVGIDQSVRIN
jgi:hypothetical protein